MTVADRLVLSGLAAMAIIGLALIFGPELTAQVFHKAQAVAPGWDYNETCKSPHDLVAADLCQQWRSANSAEAMSFYALLSLLVGVVGIIGLAYTVLSTREATRQATAATLAAVRSADAAERTYLIENRPWMDVDLSITEGISVDERGEIRVHMSVKATNISSIPAVGVDLFARAFASGGFILPPQSAVEDVARATGSHGFRTIVLPGKDTSMGFHTFFEEHAEVVRRNVEMQNANPHTPMPPQQNLSIIYGVRYRGTAVDQTFHTVYHALLNRRGGQTFVGVGYQVADEDLVLMRLDDHARLT